MWVCFNKQLVCTLYPNFFHVNMIFSAVQPLGYNKFSWGLIPEGVHGDHCQLPDYVDEFIICYHSKFIQIIERHLQHSLSKLQNWADTNGFKFSQSKTVCVHLILSSPKDSS